MHIGFGDGAWLARKGALLAPQTEKRLASKLRAPAGVLCRAKGPVRVGPSHDRLGERCRPGVSPSSLALRAPGSAGLQALTGCRRAGSLPPSDHSLLCAKASAPVSK